MISAESLERYRDFIDPNGSDVSYDPRKGMERLIGVLSPDPKGIVLVAMDQDWYGSGNQINRRVHAWLEGFGLSSSAWPLYEKPTWSYLEHVARATGESEDGSLVNLGAVVKKIEHPYQRLYSRSYAGAELAVPLVLRAVKFVSRAREHAKTLNVSGKSPHKYDSMWRILGAVNSASGERRPLAVVDIVHFLVQNPGRHRKIDLNETLQISAARLHNILGSLGNCGILEYISPKTEVHGVAGKAKLVYTLVDPKTVNQINPEEVYQYIRTRWSGFYRRRNVFRIVELIKEYPNKEYERNEVAHKLGINPRGVTQVLTSLEKLDLLQLYGYGIKGGVKLSSVAANDLTALFHELVVLPAKETAETLRPIPQYILDKRELALYLENFEEERSNVGPKVGEFIRRTIVDILAQTGGEMKLSHIIELYNKQGSVELDEVTISTHIKKILESGIIRRSRRGYYTIAENT